jgi:hypothetical protein
MMGLDRGGAGRVPWRPRPWWSSGAVADDPAGYARDYLDGDRARGCVLHLRRNGHYGLIEPWTDDGPPEDWSP